MTDDEAAYLAWLEERCAEYAEIESPVDWCRAGLHPAFSAARTMFLHTVIREDPKLTEPIPDNNTESL